MLSARRLYSAWSSATRGRYEHARGARDLTGRLADRDARELGVGLGRRDARGRGGLVERQITGTHGFVECGQAAQRVACARDALRGAVLAA